MNIEEFLNLKKGMKVECKGSIPPFNGIYEINGFYYIPEDQKVDPNRISTILYDENIPKNINSSIISQGITAKVNGEKKNKMIEHWKSEQRQDSKLYEILLNKDLIMIHYSKLFLCDEKISINRESMINKINSHRRRFAQNNLDSSMWTDEDLVIESKRIGIIL